MSDRVRHAFLRKTASKTAGSKESAPIRPGHISVTSLHFQHDAADTMIGAVNVIAR
jgi:hypothetical protein